jgi:hypothetical protein
MIGKPHPNSSTRATGGCLWVSPQVFGIGGLSLLIVVSPLVLPETTAPLAAAHAPVCHHVTHDRLVVREGRDVCGPALNGGRPVAMGFLPTRCPASEDEYRVDLAGHEDRCLAWQPANAGTQGTQGTQETQETQETKERRKNDSRSP